jgi:hypothetical protein
MHACHDLCAAYNIRQYKRHPLSNGQGFQGPPALDHLLDQHTVRKSCTAASRSALKHANDCYLHVVHHAGSLQHRATKSLVGRGTATFDLCLRTPLAYIFRDLHCIARASVQHGGKKHVSSPPRWCETTQRTGKKSGHGNGLRTLLRTFVRI